MSTEDNIKNPKLIAVLNDTAILEFDRTQPIPGQQRRYLDQMDSTMDAGIKHGNELIEKPNPLQRAQFVANSMINAILKEDFTQARAMCTYLGHRIPDLQQIKAISKTDDNGEQTELSIELVFDRSYEQAQQEQGIQFFKPEDTGTRH